MARQRILELGAITLDAHPHEEGVYRELLLHLYKNHVVIPLKKPNVMRLASFYKRGDKGDVWYGALDRNTEIEKWTRPDGEAASPEEIAEINTNGLIPNLNRFQCLFFEKNHLLIVLKKNDDGESIAIPLLANSLGTALAGKAHEMGIELTVTPKYDQSKIEGIIDDHIVRSLSIEIQRPNGDGDGDVNKIFEELEESASKKITIERFAQKGKKIKRTETLDTQLKAAVKCGSVTASVEEDLGDGSFKVRDIKSNDYPATYFWRMDNNNLLGFIDQFYQKAVDFLKGLK